MSADYATLVMEVSRLKERVNSLENASISATGQYVHGWAKAAKIVGLTSDTCQTRAKAGNFPKPCKTTPIIRGNGDVFLKPTWKLSDLRNYQEGRN
jgi:hypothetical protein